MAAKTLLHPSAYRPSHRVFDRGRTRHWWPGDGCRRLLQLPECIHEMDCWCKPHCTTMSACKACLAFLAGIVYSARKIEIRGRLEVLEPPSMRALKGRAGFGGEGARGVQTFPSV